MVWFPSCFYFDISTSINQTWYSLVSLLLEKRNFQFAFIKNVSLLSTRWLTVFFWFSLLKPEGCVCPLLTVYEVKPRHWPPAPPPPTAMCHCLQCPVPWCCSLFGSLFLLYQILSGGKIPAVLFWSCLGSRSLKIPEYESVVTQQRLFVQVFTHVFVLKYRVIEKKRKHK